RRYGFHGLSYEYLSVALDESFGARAHGRVIAAHLGSGASLCALRDGRSIATTMGFSALDGLMMSTRCGSLDPGAVLHLLEVGKLSRDALAHLLYHESGLEGVSGTSGDPRVLLALEAAGDAHARDALALYVHRIVREAGALIALLGGLDMLVFTAGIGEHSAVLRERICAQLGWLGIALDAHANAVDAHVVSSASSAIAVVVEPTNEAWIAARAALR
ncbi:acetate kinase, partial [Burkholderia multivorans]|nr:acetate kinase [Burkholderia multivorans]